MLKKKTAKEMRISDWRSDVCYYDINDRQRARAEGTWAEAACAHSQYDSDGWRSGDHARRTDPRDPPRAGTRRLEDRRHRSLRGERSVRVRSACLAARDWRGPREAQRQRSEEHTSELQSLMRISYAVFCLKKKKKKQ